MREIIIKISEKDYNDILDGETKASSLNYTIFHAIKNGVLLPKGMLEILLKLGLEMYQQS